MKTGQQINAFWDSSAVLPLLIHDAFTSRSRHLLRLYPKMVFWWGMPAEVHGALVRLFRGKRITREALDAGLYHLQQLRLRCQEIQPVDRVRELAEECLDRFQIRSADALQLAAAMIWCHQKPRNRLFICYDSELTLAAQHCGFDVHS
jgi:uncharacterized protein